MVNSSLITRGTTLFSPVITAPAARKIVITVISVNDEGGNNITTAAASRPRCVRCPPRAVSQPLRQGVICLIRIKSGGGEEPIPCSGTAPRKIGVPQCTP